MNLVIFELLTKISGLYFVSYEEPRECF